MSWIQTYTGRKFFPLDPSHQDVCIDDIAHALALKCRYTGHCREFYSVAQHSVFVSRMVPQADALWGLLHDAAEAYLPDVARPIKDSVHVRRAKGYVPFGRAEGSILVAVACAFGMQLEMPLSIKVADVRLLERERRQLLGPPPEEWSTAEMWDGDARPIHCWTWLAAKRRFLRRFRELTEGAERG